MERFSKTSIKLALAVFLFAPVLFAHAQSGTGLADMSTGTEGTVSSGATTRAVSSGGLPPSPSTSSGPTASPTGAFSVQQAAITTTATSSAPRTILPRPASQTPPPALAPAPAAPTLAPSPSQISGGNLGGQAPTAESSGANSILIMALTFGAILSGAWLSRMLRAKKGNDTKKDPCGGIKKSLDAKKRELGVAAGEFSAQQVALELLNKKIEEKKNKTEDEIKRKAKEAAKNKIIASEDKESREMADLAYKAKEGYDELLAKYEKAKELLETLGIKKRGLEAEVKALEASYKACRTGGGMQIAQKIIGKIKLPLLEHEEEYLDILNDKGEKTGERRTYDEVHREGLIHRTVHIWLANSKGELLIQKREKNRQAYPGYWDISVAGHISAGQTSIEAAKRETKEEVGLVSPDSAYQYLFTVHEHTVLNNGTYINNEFQDVYLVHLDVSVGALKLQVSEVEAVRWMSIEALKKWIKGEGENLAPHVEEYEKLFEYLGSP